MLDRLRTIFKRLPLDGRVEEQKQIRASRAEDRKLKLKVPKLEGSGTKASPPLTTVKRHSLIGLPVELQLEIADYLDEVSKHALRHTSRHLLHTIKVDLKPWRLNPCAQFVFHAILEKDGILRKIPKSMGGGRPSKRWACALCKTFHPPQYFDRWGVEGMEMSMIDRDPRHRFCGEHYTLGRRFQEGEENEWFSSSMLLCMHCGFEKAGPQCICTCPFCGVARHESFTRTYNMEHGCRLDFAFHRRKSDNKLIVREDQYHPRKRDMATTLPLHWQPVEVRHWYMTLSCHYKRVVKGPNDAPAHVPSF